MPEQSNNPFNFWKELKRRKVIRIIIGYAASAFIILEAVDMLDNFNVVLRFLAKNVLRMRPGYFRLLSDFELEINHKGQNYKESGTTLHEVVLFKSAE